jgi:hypothetical protein
MNHCLCHTMFHGIESLIFGRAIAFSELIHHDGSKATTLKTGNKRQTFGQSKHRAAVELRLSLQRLNDIHYDVTCIRCTDIDTADSRLIQTMSRLIVLRSLGSITTHLWRVG